MQKYLHQWFACKKGIIWIPGYWTYAMMKSMLNGRRVEIKLYTNGLSVWVDFQL